MEKYEFPMVVTRLGDKGTSSDYDGRPHSKSALLFEVLGGLDELSSWVGKIKHICVADYHRRHIGNMKKDFEQIQLWLQYGGSLVATNPLVYEDQSNPLYERLHKLSDKETQEIETWIKQIMDKRLVIKDEFVIPGRTIESADVHIARTICRRVERLVVKFMVENENRYDLKYLSIILNRMSDLLFVLSLWLEQ